MFEQALLFFSFLIPKAGLKVGEFPVYLSLLSFFYFVSRGVLQSLLIPRFRILFLSFMIVVVIFLIMNFLDLVGGRIQRSLPDLLAYSLSIASCFAYFSGRTIKIDLARLERIIRCSFYALCIYGLMQKIFGDYTVLIPGVTANLTDAANENFLADKNNMIWGINYLKLTSTYQNGNLFGVNILMLGFFVIALNHQKRSSVVLPFALLSIVVLLTASVSVYLGLIGGTLYYFARVSGKLRLGVLLLVVLFFLILFFLFSQFEDNIISQIIFERLLNRDLASGAGRTEKIVEFFHFLYENPFYFFSGALLTDYSGDEIYEVAPLAILQMFGIFFLIFYVALAVFIISFIKNRTFRIPFVSYLIAAIADGAFWLPPTALNLFLLIGIATTFSQRLKQDTLNLDKV